MHWKFLGELQITTMPNAAMPQLKSDALAKQIAQHSAMMIKQKQHDLIDSCITKQQDCATKKQTKKS